MFQSIYWRLISLCEFLYSLKWVFGHIIESEPGEHSNCLINISLKQYFADRDIFCAGRVAEEDLQRVTAATGGTVQTSVNNIIDEVSSHFDL